MPRVFWRESYIASAASVLALLACSGCGSGGPELGSVSGKVTMDGKPLPNALVVFVPEDGGRPATGKTDAEGRYELVSVDGDGALPGKHKVTVTTVREAQAAPEIATDSPEYEAQLVSGSSGTAPPPPKETIPARYNTQSTLVEEVASGSNEINLELTSAN